MPAPTLPLTNPNRRGLACSVSRTQIEISGPKQPMVNKPDAMAITKNKMAAWWRMKVMPCFISAQIRWIR